MDAWLGGVLPRPNEDNAPQFIEGAINAVIAGEVEWARQLLARLDSAAARSRRQAAASAVGAVPKLARTAAGHTTSPGAKREAEVARRDSHTCRYCGTPVLVWDVWKQLGRLFPRDFGYHKNWRWPDAHQSIWLYALSFDHVVPRCVGGTHALDNLLTVCYLHQHVKSSRSLAALGWDVLPPARTNWDGLQARILSLRAAVTRLLRDGSGPSAPPSEGNFERRSATPAVGTTVLSIADGPEGALGGSQLQEQRFVDDEQGYRAWVGSHSNGFVFKRKKAGEFTVHLAHCDHIAWFGDRDHPSGEWRYTQRPGKWCFEHRGQAASWVRDHAVTTNDCRSCAPAFSRPTVILAQPSVRDAQPAEPGVIRAGSLVEVKDENGDRSVYRIGHGSLPPDGDRILKLETPVARSLMGGQGGDTVEVPTSRASYRLLVIRVEDPSG